MMGIWMWRHSANWFSAILISSCFFQVKAVADIPEQVSPEDSFASLQTADFRIMDPAECWREYKKERSEQQSSEDRYRRGIEGAAFFQRDMERLNSDEFGETENEMGWFDWAPTGTRSRAVRPQCSADALETLLLQTGSRKSLQSDAIDRFFKACGEQLAREAPDNSVALAKITRTRYQICDHPRMRKVLMRVSDGNVIRGVLALKPGNIRRPLVIVKAGVFGNVGDTSHRFQLMQFFDATPFNVLALASTTGADFTRDNEHLSVGGYDEGMHLVRIARQVRQLPIGKFISSVHVTGVSLGGHGVLYASYLNPFNPGPSNQPLISSALAMCPVVELRPSMKDLFTGGPKRKLARWVFLDEIKTVVDAVPVLRRFFPDVDSAPPERIPEMVADGAVDYYKKRSSDWALPPFNGRHIQNKKEFWALNSFTHLVDKPFPTPTLAFAAHDDWIVDTYLNSKVLAERASRANDNQLHVVTVPRGNHCVFSMIYGWDIASALTRGFVLSHSPELLARARFESALIPAKMLPYRIKVWDAEQHLSQDFRAEAKEDTFRVRFHIWNGYAHQSGCWTQSVYEGDKDCIRTETAEIPWSALGSAAWAKSPRNEVEAEALTRWMNANLRIVDATGKLLHGLKTLPARFRWVNYD